MLFRGPQTIVAPLHMHKTTNNIIKTYLKNSEKKKKKSTK